jgi:hypothetical protein
MVNLAGLSFPSWEMVPGENQDENLKRCGSIAPGTRQLADEPELLTLSLSDL